MPRVLAAALLAVSASVASAQDAAQVKDALAQFQHERAEAAKSFPASELTPADEFAARAAAALKEGNAAAAARFARAARWQLPFRPAHLPERVTRVFGVSRLRHGDRVNALSYSPDGRRLASASRDGTVRVWNLDNGREVLRYSGHAEQAEKQTENTNVFRVPAVAYSPDGKLIASSGGKDIHVWDAATGELRHKLAAHTAPPRGLAWSPDGKSLVSGGDDRKVILWDVAKEKPAHTYAEQAQRVEAVAVNGTGKLAATINAAGELYVYATTGEYKPLLTIAATKDGLIGFGVAFAGDQGIVTCGGDNTAKLIASPNPAGTTTGTGTAVRTYVGHAEKLNDLDVSRDGKLLVTGSRDSSVRVWDVATGKALYTFQGPPGGILGPDEREAGVTAVAVSPDGKYVAAGGVDGAIRLWPLSASDEHRAATEATDSLWTVAVSPDGKHFAAAGADRAIRVYDTATGKLQKTLTGHKGAIPCVAFVGNTALASASGDRLVKVWDLASGTATDCAGHTAAVLAVAADDAGKLLASGSVDKSVRGWEPGSGKSLWAWPGKSAVCTVAVRKDGQRVAVGTADGWLTILAPAGSAAPRVVGAVAAHRAGVAGVAFHPDGGRLVTCGGDGVVRVWALSDAGAPTPLAKFEPPARAGATSTLTPITAVAYSADGRLVAFAGADMTTRVWDAQTGSEVRGFRGHTDWVTSVAFTPDGRTILSAGVDKAVRQFDLPRQDTLAAAGHTQPVRCVAVSRDGKFLATGSADRTIKVWDLTTGQPVAQLTGSGDNVNTLGFAGPNTVVAGGDDNRVRWWTIRPAKELRTAPAGRVFNLAASPDGDRVTVAWIRPNEKQAGFGVFDAKGAAVSQVTETGRDLTCATVTPDGTLAVSGGDDGVVRVWNLTTRKRVGEDWSLLPQTAADLGLTPDKKTLVAIDVDGTVKIADVATRNVRTTVNAVSGGVVALVVSPTGDKFATLAADGTVRAWSLKGAELRSWKLPVPAAAAAFGPDGKTLVTGNKDGTAYVLELP